MGYHDNGLQKPWLLWYNVNVMILLLWIPTLATGACSGVAPMDEEQTAGRASLDDWEEYVYSGYVRLNMTWQDTLADTSSDDYGTLKDLIYPKLYTIFNCYTSAFKWIINIKFESGSIVTRFDLVLNQEADLTSEQVSEIARIGLLEDPDLGQYILAGAVDLPALTEDQKTTMNTVMATIGAVSGLLVTAGTAYGLFKQISKKLKKAGEVMKDGVNKIDGTDDKDTDKKDKKNEAGEKEEPGMMDMCKGICPKCPEVECKMVDCPPIVCKMITCPAICNMANCCPGMTDTTAAAATATATTQGNRMPEPLLWVGDKPTASGVFNNGMQPEMTSPYGNSMNAQPVVTSPQCNGVHVHNAVTSPYGNNPHVHYDVTSPVTSPYGNNPHIHVTSPYNNASPVPAVVTSPYNNVMQVSPNVTSSYGNGSPVSVVMTSPYDDIVEAPPIVTSQYQIPQATPYMAAQSAPGYMVYTT